MDGYKIAAEAHAVLVLVYPVLLSLDNPVPLKLGIHQDFIDKHPEVKPFQVKKMLLWLTCRRAYLAACARGGQRFGLGGPAGVVSDKEAEFAVKRFLERNAAAKDPWPKEMIEVSTARVLFAAGSAP